MNRIVLDTNILLTGLKSNKGHSYKLLQMIPNDLFEFAISVPLILEYEATLVKHFVPNLYTLQEISDLLNFLCFKGIRTKIFYLWRPVLKDPFDDHILEVAIASESNYIITFNIKDFLEARKFGITVLTPKEFISVLGV